MCHPTAKQLIITLLFGILSLSAVAQNETLVVGQIFDRYTQQPIPNATIGFRNTPIVAVSNNEGYFLLRSAGSYSRIVVSAKRYKNSYLRIKKNMSAGVDVWLTPVGPSAIPLEKVVEDARSHNIVQQVILHKMENYPPATRRPTTLSERLKAYAYHVPGAWLKDEIIKGTASWSPDSTAIIPLFSSDKIYRQPHFPSVRKDKSLLKDKEITILPLNKEYVEKLVGLLTLQQNFYREHVEILGKYFLSPLAVKSNRQYAYFMQDSATIHGRKYYTVGFRPKHKDNYLLTGSMKIDSATWALAEINASIPQTLDINFAHSLNIKQEFLLNRGKWDYHKISTLLVLKLPIPIGIRDKPLLGVIDKELIFAQPQPNDGDKVFLQQLRADERKPVSDSIYTRVEQLHNTRLMKQLKWVTDLLMYQYAHVGKIDIGPVSTLYHRNVLDGSMGAFSFRTGESLWKNFTVGGSVGYAFDNRTWKFGGQALYRFPTKNFQQMQFSYSKNAYRTGFSEDIFLVDEQKVSLSDDNMFSSMFRFKPNYAINEVGTWTIQYAREWSREFKTTLTLFDNRYYSNKYVQFVSQGEPISSILHRGAKIDFRFSQDQLIWDQFFGRRFLSNHYPVFHVQLEGGKYDMGNISGTYGKIQSTVNQSIDFIGGNLYYTGEAGYILGRVPFPLLRFERGNETLFFSQYNFNLMNNLEYVGDKYVHLYVDYYSSGLLLKELPIINLLHFKEIFSLRVAENGLRSSHAQLLGLPQGAQSLNTPYVEAGAGVYNILSCLGIQSVWRLTHRNDPGANNWGLRAFFYINF